MINPTKKRIYLILLIILTVYIQIPITFSLLTSRYIVQSSGSINYTPSPIPISTSPTSSNTPYFVPDLTYPMNKWQRLWFVHNTGNYLGEGPHELELTFDNNWKTEILAYNLTDNIEFRSSRTINISKEGDYIFYIGSDDGIRFWIDEELILDKWFNRSYTLDEFVKYLSAGYHRFRLDYYEEWIDARVSFFYEMKSSGSSFGILGDDYLIYSNYNGDPSYWKTRLQPFIDFKCTTARLGFSFSTDPKSSYHLGSTYSFDKMNAVLDYLNSVGVKGILAYFTMRAPTMGSQQWVDNWVQVAKDFKGDSRVEGFHLYNEPYPETWSSTGPTGGVHDLDSFNIACAYLIGKIREIDPSRKIFYPIVKDVVADCTWNEFYASLSRSGVLKYGNIVYDVCHPYYFENQWDEGLDPAQKAQWYKDRFLIPAKNLFGAQNIWVGETFAFSRYEGYNYSKQTVFLTNLINICVENNISFQVWCFFCSTDRAANIDAIKASKYYSTYCQ